jgi:hypothetical protein
MRALYTGFKSYAKIRGSKIRSLQLIEFLHFVQDICQCFPEEGTVNLETWNKLEDVLRACHMAEGLECIPTFTFGMWSLIKDCLRPTASHKASSVFELGCGTHLLQSVRQYPLKEQNAVGGGATEPSMPPPRPLCG